MKLRYLKIIFIIILLVNIIFYINEIHKVLDIKRKVKAEFYSKYNKEIDIGFVFNTRVGIGAFSFDKDGYYYGNAHIVDEPEIEFSFKYFNHNEKIAIEKYYYMAVWGKEYKNFLNDILRDKLNEISNVKINLSYNLEEYQMQMKEKNYRF